MKVNARKYLLLLDLAETIVDCNDCIDECEELGGTLDYVRGKPCEDCDCLKCIAVRALRHRPRKSPTRGRT